MDEAVTWEELVDDTGVYSRFNRWTTTDGILHFVNPINELGAAILLAQDGAQTTDQGRDNFELTISRGPSAADDYIIREVAGLGRAGFGVAIQDPVGLYIDGWDDTGWTRPDGSPVGDPGVRGS